MEVLIAIRLAVVALALALAGCGGDGGGNAGTRTSEDFRATDPGPVHVHGLGVNPADGALLIATHTGLFRAAEGEQTAVRVGGSFQDTMGFTVVGPDRFLGSGHPDLRSGDPPYLGLIESDDAGESWSPVSLRGEADFHVLRAAGERVVGYGSDFESRRQQLLVSDDGGRTWSQRRTPMILLDLVLSPSDPDVWLAAGANGLTRTADAGATWRKVGGPAGLLAWAAPDALYRVLPNGLVSRSPDAGTSWEPAGEVGGQPAAFAADEDVLYAALHSGLIKMSRDGGATWSVRSRPTATTS